MRMMSFALLVLGAMTGTVSAQAQTKYPERTVRVVIPFAPGGNTDIMGRRFAARLTPLVGQQIIVDNKAGAGGNIGAAEIARAKPDGYNLLIGTSSTRLMPFRAINRFSGTSPGMITSAPVSLMTRRATSWNFSISGPGFS